MSAPDLQRCNSPPKESTTIDVTVQMLRNMGLPSLVRMYLAGFEAPLVVHERAYVRKFCQLPAEPPHPPNDQQVVYINARTQMST
jgi:hypothetical protein